jgi:hypothetical protein
MLVLRCQGAFTFRGNMIDMPLLLQAKNIVQLQQLLAPNATDATADAAAATSQAAPPTTQA